MLYQKFITLVEDHAELLTKNWIYEVKNNPSTGGYKNMSDELLGKRVFNVYHRLGNWLLTDEPNVKESANHFIQLGKERASEGLKVSEVIYALILARVELWQFILKEGIINSTFDYQMALDFYQKLNNFFDKAIYFVAVGFESEKEPEKEKITTDDFIEKSVSAITHWIIDVQ